MGLPHSGQARLNFGLHPPNPRRKDGDPGIREAAEAKLLASELAVEATWEALQIHGAYGYSSDYVPWIVEFLPGLMGGKR